MGCIQPANFSTGELIPDFSHQPYGKVNLARA